MYGAEWSQRRRTRSGKPHVEGATGQARERCTDYVTFSSSALVPFLSFESVAVKVTMVVAPASAAVGCRRAFRWTHRA